MIQLTTFHSDDGPRPMTDRPPPPMPEYVRAKTFEEMSPSEREMYGPGRRYRLPQCETEYDVLRDYDDEVSSFHRPKP
jgi:hypothetical protein